MNDETTTPNRSEFRGIPVFSMPQPAGLPFFVGLMIRTGWGDETLATRGLSHLVEHLALPGRHVPELELNGTVQDSTTLFWFSGEKEAALEELLATTSALRDLPLDRLESERSILLTEEGSRSIALVPNLKSLRFGARGYGLSHYDEYALRWVERDAVAAWAASRFTRGNAALYMLGDLPEDFDLELHDGDRLPPPPPEPIDYVAYPSVFRHGPPATVAVSMLGRRSVDLLTALRILEVRLHDTLRHQHGVTYSTDWEYDPLTADDAHVVVWADALESNVERVRNVLLTVLDELAFAGPTDQERERDLSRFRESLADPLGTVGRVHSAAETEILNGTHLTDSELLARIEASSSRDIADALAAAARSLLLCVPQEATPVGGRFNEYPMDSPRPVTGRRHKRKRVLRRRAESGPEKGLVVGADGVRLIAEGFSSTVRYDECVALLRFDEGWRGLWSEDGFYLLVDPQIWKDGDRIVSAIDAAVPDERVVPWGASAEEDQDFVAGEAAALEQRWPDAIEHLRRFLERNPTNAFAGTYLTAALEGEGRHAEMLDAATHAVAADDSLAAAHRMLARALRHQGRRPEAVDAIRIALALDPSDLEVLADYAMHVGDEGNHEDALRAATRAAELYPDTGAAWYAVATAAEAQGDFAREEEALRKMIELEPNAGMWHNNLGWHLLRKGREKDALSHFDRALALEPKNWHAARNRPVALALLGREAQAAEAANRTRTNDLEAYDDALRHDADDLDTRSRRAGVLLELDRVEDAALDVAELERRAREAGRIDRLLEAADYFLDLGEEESARRLFDEALAVSDDTAEACHYRAFAAAHFADRDSALEGSARMQRLHGSHPLASDTAGYAAYCEGDVTGARERFEQTIERYPLRCCAHAWRAISAVELGDTATGTATARRAKLLCARGGVHCSSIRRLSRTLETS